MVGDLLPGQRSDAQMGVWEVGLRLSIFGFATLHVTLERPVAGCTQSGACRKSSNNPLHAFTTEDPLRIALIQGRSSQNVTRRAALPS